MLLCGGSTRMSVMSGCFVPYIPRYQSTFETCTHSLAIIYVHILWGLGALEHLSLTFKGLKGLGFWRFLLYVRKVALVYPENCQVITCIILN